MTLSFYLSVSLIEYYVRRDAPYDLVDNNWQKEVTSIIATLPPDAETRKKLVLIYHDNEGQQ